MIELELFFYILYGALVCTLLLLYVVAERPISAKEEQKVRERNRKRWQEAKEMVQKTLSKKRSNST